MEGAEQPETLIKRTAGVATRRQKRWNLRKARMWLDCDSRVITAVLRFSKIFIHSREEVYAWAFFSTLHFGNFGYPLVI